MGKIWHKPLHKRKVWKTMTLFDKVAYYLQPFMLHIADTWLQPLPFPTLFKIFYSCFIIMLTLVPLIFYIFTILTYYAVVQYMLESSLNIIYPTNLDILRNTIHLFKYQIKNEKHIEFINLYMGRRFYIITALASCVDYFRLALALIAS